MRKTLVVYFVICGCHFWTVVMETCGLVWSFSSSKTHLYRFLLYQAREKLKKGDKVTVNYLRTKRYEALWDAIYLKNRLLYRKYENDDRISFELQLIPLKYKISCILRELHNILSGRYFGVMKTKETRERLYCDQFRSDVGKRCEECQAF